MYTTTELFSNQHEVNSFHDVVVEALNQSMSDPDLLVVFNSLQASTRNEAHSWGLSDTCFRDMVYVELQNNAGAWSVSAQS